jgi:hypothetical protein
VRFSPMFTYNITGGALGGLSVPSFATTLATDSGSAVMQDSGKTVEGTVEFVGDMGETFTTQIATMPHDGRIQDINTVLRRPIQITSGTMSAATIGTLIWGSSIDALWSVSNAYNFLYSYVTGVRFTTVIKVIVAHTPMVQGGYRLCFEPNGGYNNYDRLNYTATAYQLPGANLLLNCENTVTLKIPWTSVFDYYPINDPAFRASLITGSNYLLGGSVGLFNYLPIRIGDGSVPTYTIYLSYEDVESVGESTPLSVYMQSGFGTHKYVNGKYVYTKQPPPPPVKGRAASTSEQKAAAKSAGGAISSALSAVGDSLVMAGDKLGVFPLASAVVKSVGWASKIGSMAAAYFGFSKPLVLTVPNRVMVLNTGFIHNADLPDYAVPTATMAENTVCRDLEVISDIEEMAISYVATREGPLARFQYLVSSARDSTLFMQQTSPLSMVWSGVSQNSVYNISRINGVYFPSPLAYVSSMFKMYRSGFIFSFTCAKTPFHAGRLQIGWVPVTNNGTPPTVGYYGPPVASSGMSYLSIIWDIKADCEVEFTVPYTSFSKYKDCCSGTGNLFVRVIDPLVAPANVTQSVDIFVTVRGAPDCEFAVPCTPSSHMPAPPASGGTWPNVVMQAGLPTPAMPDEVMGSGSAVCIGEHIMSLKQLCLKAGMFVYTGQTTSPGAAQPITYSWPSSQFTVGYDFVAGNVTGSMSGGFLRWVAPMYAFFSGGMCVSAIPGTSASVSFVTGNTAPIIPNIGASPYLNSNCDFFMLEPTSKAIHIRLPFYSAFPRLPVTLNDVGSVAAYTAINSNYLSPPVFTVSSTNILGSVASFHERLADDGCFSTFLGAPPCVYGKVAATGYDIAARFRQFERATAPPN